MKSIVKLPHSVVQQAETLGANCGMTPEQYIANVLEEKSQQLSENKLKHETTKPWMKGFGDLSDLADENRRVLEIIEEEFGEMPTENNP